MAKAATKSSTDEQTDPAPTPPGTKDSDAVVLAWIQPNRQCAGLAPCVYTAPPPPLTGVSAGSPGKFTPATATVPATLAALKADKVIGDAGTAKPGAAWTQGQSVKVGDGSEAYWDGGKWVAGKVPTPGPQKGQAAPGNTFPAETTVTASDAANAAKLAGLGYVAKPTTAWTTGQKITVGTFDFSWDGTAWKAGAAA